MGLYDSAYPSIHAMLDGYYASAQVSDLHAALHQRLSTAVKSALKKAKGRVLSFEQQLRNVDLVHQVQKEADMIMANVYRWVHHA